MSRLLKCIFYFSLFTGASHAEAQQCRDLYSALQSADQSQFDVSELIDQGHLQEAAWLARDKGDKIHQKQVEESIIDILKTSEVLSRAPVQRGASEVELITLTNGVKAIFKPEVHKWKWSRARPFHTSNMPQREVARYLFDRAIEAELTPVTVLREIDGTTGSLQIFVNQSIQADFISTVRTRIRLEILDALSTTFDRSPSNQMHVLGGLAAIDNAMAFSLKPPHYSFGITSPSKIDFSSPFIRRAMTTFKKVSASEVTDLLKDYLSPEELTHTIGLVDAAGLLGSAPPR